jgi:hypothetical protein
LITHRSIDEVAEAAAGVDVDRRLDERSAMHPASRIQHLASGGWGGRARRARDQWAQEKPLPQLWAGPAPAPPESDVDEAKLEIWRSTWSLWHVGQRTPSAEAFTDWRRENSAPQSLHLYS